MELVGHTRASLIDYTCAQVGWVVPDGTSEIVRRDVTAAIDAALSRVATCVEAVRMWPQGRFDPLNSSQYAIYLYYLANQIWRESSDPTVPTRLFLLNKALNAIDLFYEIQMPEIFFIGHSAGVVLSKATYGDYLVLYQNCTVGKNHGEAPSLGERVVLYPNSAVIGRCRIGSGTVISQGTGVINQDTPGDCLVFPGNDGELVLRRPRRDIPADIFRI